MRLIDADALLKELNKAEAGTLHSTKLVQPENKFAESLARASFRVARLAISNKPTIDPIKHGLWIGKEAEIFCSVGRECNCCHKVRAVGYYCSNCGAKMDADEERG